MGKKSHVKESIERHVGRLVDYLDELLIIRGLLFNFLL